MAVEIENVYKNPKDFSDSDRQRLFKKYKNKLISGKKLSSVLKKGTWLDDSEIEYGHYNKLIFKNNGTYIKKYKNDDGKWTKSNVYDKYLWSVKGNTLLIHYLDTVKGTDDDDYAWQWKYKYKVVVLRDNLLLLKQFFSSSCEYFVSLLYV